MLPFIEELAFEEEEIGSTTVNALPRASRLAASAISASFSLLCSSSLIADLNSSARNNLSLILFARSRGSNVKTQQSPDPE